MSNRNNIPGRDEDVSQYYPTDETYNDNEDVFYSYDNKKTKSKGRITKFTSSQLILLAIIFVVYTAVIFTAAWLIFYRPAQPSDNDIPFETDPPVTETGTGTTAPPLDNKDPVGSESETEGEEDNVVSGDYTKVKDGVYNVLVVGRDSAATLADVIMIVNMDTANNTASIMQIPRDTLVNIGVPTNKANAVYSSYVSAAYREGNENSYLAGAEHYETLLEQNLCINIHHSVVINLESFIEIVDLFGGVDVYVPEAMEYSDPEQNLYISIGSGQQHLDGYNAMCFVRYRSGYVQADLGRVNAQKIFLTAFFQKVKNSVSLTNLGLISDVATTISKNVITNMTVSDIIFYAKALLAMDLGSITMTTLPGNIEDYSSYYVMNREATLDLINQYFNIYQSDITDSIFDRNMIFCDGNNTNICNIYYGDSKNILDGVYNADEIRDESIYIPHT